jgi:hypothetical protein
MEFAKYAPMDLLTHQLNNVEIGAELTKYCKDPHVSVPEILEESQLDNVSIVLQLEDSSPQEYVSFALVIKSLQMEDVDVLLERDNRDYNVWMLVDQDNLLTHKGDVISVPLIRWLTMVDANVDQAL